MPDLGRQLDRGRTARQRICANEFGLGRGPGNDPCRAGRRLVWPTLDLRGLDAYARVVGRQPSGCINFYVEYDAGFPVHATSLLGALYGLVLRLAAALFARAVSHEGLVMRQGTGFRLQFRAHSGRRRSRAANGQPGRSGSAACHHRRLDAGRQLSAGRHHDEPGLFDRRRVRLARARDQGPASAGLSAAGLSAAGLNSAGLNTLIQRAAHQQQATLLGGLNRLRFAGLPIAIFARSQARVAK